MVSINNSYGNNTGNKKVKPNGNQTTNQTRNTGSVFSSGKKDVKVKPNNSENANDQSVWGKFKEGFTEAYDKYYNQRYFELTASPDPHENATNCVGSIVGGVVNGIIHVFK